MKYPLHRELQSTLNLYNGFKKSRYKSFARYLYYMQTDVIEFCVNCKKGCFLIVEHKNKKICEVCYKELTLTKKEKKK